MANFIPGKAYEMNAFALARHYATSRRGCPEEFTRIEAKLNDNEAVFLAFTAKNIRIKGKIIPSGKINAEAACALSSDFLYIVSSKFRTLKFPLFSFRDGVPVREYRDLSIKKNSLLNKAVVSVDFNDSTVSFEVNPSTASNFCNDLKDAFTLALTEADEIM